MMKEFLAFVKKEFLHIFRDKRTILIVLIMPIVQIILFGYAISTEIYNVRVDIVGDVTDPKIRKAVERIDNNLYLQINEILPSVSMIDTQFKKNKSDAAVCFSRNYDNNLDGTGRTQIKIIGDGSDPNTAQMIINYIKGVLQSEQAEIISEITSSEGTGMLQPQVQLMYNPAMKSSYNFVPGVMGLILMLICSMMTAISIVREKETGTMELLLVSPVKPVWIIISKAIPYLVLSIINFISILLLSHFVMEVPINGSILLLSLVSVVFVITSLAIGLLISVIASTQRTAMLISGMGLMMPTMIFSGIIFPCESMPEILQWFSHIIPAKWYIIMVKKIMIQGDSFIYIIKELAILCSMAAALLTVSIRSFKTRL